jgi:hypothetical protein
MIVPVSIFYSLHQALIQSEVLNTFLAPEALRWKINVIIVIITYLGLIRVYYCIIITIVTMKTCRKLVISMALLLRVVLIFLYLLLSTILI